MEKTLFLSCAQFPHLYKEVVGQGDPRFFKPHNHLMFFNPQFSASEPWGEGSGLRLHLSVWAETVPTSSLSPKVLKDQWCHCPHTAHIQMRSYSAEPIMHIVWVIKVSNPVFSRLLRGLTLIQVCGKGTFFDQLEEVGWASSSWPHSEPDELLSASFWSISQVMILFVVVGFFFTLSLPSSLYPSIHPPTIHHLSSTWNKRNQSSLKSTFKRILGDCWGASLVVQMVKHLPAMWETQVRSLGREDPLEKEMATHSSTLAWKIPWMEEPGRLRSMGLQRVGHDWATSFYFFLSIAIEDMTKTG